MNNSLFLYPSKQTFIDSYYKNKNFCNAKSLFAGFFDNRIIYRILMQFELSAIPECAVVASAHLQLYCVRNDYLQYDNYFSVHSIIENWDEKRVCFENQPSFNEGKGNHVRAGITYMEYISFDITQVLGEWRKNPENNFGLLLKAQNETDEQSLLGFSIAGQNAEDVQIRLEIELVTVPEKRKNSSTSCVAILTPQFFQLSANRCLFGGGERYVIDLAKLLGTLGYHVEVFQPTVSGDWTREYDGIIIHGLSDPEADKDFYIQLNGAFARVAKDFDFHIYFNMDLIYPMVLPNSICISHGIWWDSTQRDYWRSESWYNQLFKGLDNVEVLVSVDTNTINWINAVNPFLKCKKVFIPNYVDTTVFQPDEPTMDKDFVRVLYPRRLCNARGWGICKELAAEMTSKQHNIRFSFVGRGASDNAEKYMELFCKHYPNVDYTWYEMNQMNKAYKDADIVLIPSLYSEGTSLSLLEAMACAKPVIAGLVGGLTDLILQGYNGYLVQVSKESVKEFILKLASNPELRHTIGNRALAVAQCFSKTIWEERWETLIREVFQ